ncbi:MAG: hypothetical protein ACLVB1_01030 [Blautia obeum]
MCAAVSALIINGEFPGTADRRSDSGRRE